MFGTTLSGLLHSMCFFCSDQTARIQEALQVARVLLRSLQSSYPVERQVAMHGNPVSSASTLTFSTLTTLAAPAGFPSTGNGLWYKAPGTIWTKDWLPVGNGYLAGSFSPLLCDILSWRWMKYSYDPWRHGSRNNTVEYRVSLERRSISGSGS